MRRRKNQKERLQVAIGAQKIEEDIPLFETFGTYLGIFGKIGHSILKSYSQYRTKLDRGRYLP